MDEIYQKNANLTIVSFKRDITNYQQQFELSKQNIVIKKFPEETLALTFSVGEEVTPYCSSSCHYYGRSCTCPRTPRTYELRLTFKNYLHIMSKEYAYEVSCKIMSKKADTKVLFTEKVIRKQMEETVTVNTDIKSTNFSGKISFLFEIIRDPIESCDTKNPIQLAHIYDQLFWKNQEYQNITINVSGKIFNVEEQILSQRSPVFKAMFSNNMSESERKVIYIEDFDSETIAFMLHYIYTSDTKHIQKDVKQIYRAAHKYEIKDLQNECIEFIKFNISERNVISFLNLAHLYEINELDEGLNLFIKQFEAKLVYYTTFWDYLRERINIETIVDTLKMCNKYHPKLRAVQKSAFEFLKLNMDKVVQMDDYYDFLEGNKRITKEIFQFLFNGLYDEFNEPPETSLNTQKEAHPQ